MARRSQLIVACAAIAVLPAASAEAAPAPASARLANCNPSPDVAKRSAEFVGQVKGVPGSQRMQMRFTLLEKLGDGRFLPVALPELKLWRKSKPGAKAFNFTQRVTSLRDGGRYKVVASFRWLDATGKQIRTATRRSGACSSRARCRT
jgi:hypothetical protein